MSHKLDYFKEFLDDPSKYDLVEFYEWVNRWGEYVIAHKSDFNYLVDEEWAEIRERLKAEVKKRNAIKQKINDEWEEIHAEMDKLDKSDTAAFVKNLKRELAFMKTHKALYNFPDSDIAECARDIKDLENSLFTTRLAQQNYRMHDRKLDESLSKLDESMLKAHKKTGKFPRIQFWKNPNNN